MDRKILSEIQRFKLMSGYNPKELLSEQISLIEAVQFAGKTNLFYVENKDYPNAKYIGYIDDSTKQISLNSFGQRKINLEKYTISKYLEMGTVVTDNFLENFVENEERTMGNLNQTLKSVGGADWGRTLQGSGVMNPTNQGKYPVATNILGPGYDGEEITYNLLCAEINPGFTSTPVRQEGPTVSLELDEFQIGASTKVFCDNMVKVNLNDDNNKKELNTIVNQIVRYINAPDDVNGVSSLSKLNNMTIQGQADSARPTWSPGEPCSQSTTELDHDYGGIEKKPKDQTTEEERHKMNKFLATMRAKNYKDEIIDEVKKQTGKDITITELDAIDHYGKGDSFRGPQFRSMIFKSNAPKHEYKDITTKGKSTSVVNYENIIKSGFKVGRIDNLPTGNDSEINLPVIVRGEKDYYTEANEILKENFTDYTSIALPEISVSWGSPTFMEVTTWDSKTYALPMVKDETGSCNVFKKLEQSALAQHFIGTGRTYAKFKRCSSYEKDSQPVTYYESSESIIVNGKTFYKLKFFGFVLVPVIMMSDKFISFPSEEQIRAEKQYKNSNYTPKQLQKIKDLAYM
jgi:hypothetical protein